MLFLCLSLIDVADEQESFEYLYRSYRDAMYKAAYAVVYNQYDAEDAVHNAFLNITRNISAVTCLAPQNQKAYLCRAARNCALNISSKQNRETCFLSRYMRETNLSNNEDDILDEISRKEQVNQIVKCIQRLPDTYRDVLYLNCVEGLEPHQIARALGLKDATARQRIRRGKRILIDEIKKLEE